MNWFARDSIRIASTDPLFFRDPKSGAYRPIDAADYARIVDGSIRL